MIDVENDFDVAVLNFIKALYKMTKYNKDEVRRVLHPDVVGAVMITVDVTERNGNAKVN